MIMIMAKASAEADHEIRERKHTNTNTQRGKKEGLVGEGLTKSPLIHHRHQQRFEPPFPSLHK
jgi:hypothetical protein